MKKLTLTVAALAVAFAFMPSTTVAAGSTPMAAIHQALMEFNSGNYQGWAAACASPTMITDDFPPHTWNGPTACSDWVAAFKAFVKKSKISSMTVAFGTPKHMAVTGNVAYVVLPATLHFNQNGKPVKETGSVMTIVLKKTSSGWLMTAWTWADGS